MSFLSRIFGRKKKEENVLKSFTIDEFYDHGLKEIKEAEEKTQNVFRKYSDELQNPLKTLHKSNQELSDAKVFGTFDIRVVKRAKSNRENVNKQVEILTEKLRTPKNQDMKSLIEFNNNALMSINSCLENMGKSFYYTKVVFPQESDKVSENLKTVSDTIKMINVEIVPFVKSYQNYNVAVATVDEYKRISEVLENEEEKIKNKSKELLNLNSELEKIEEDIDSYYKSEIGKKRLQLEDEIELLKDEEKKAIDSIKALVLPISGNISAIKKLSESGRYAVDSDLKKCFEEFEENIEKVDKSFFMKLKEIFKDEYLDIQSHKKEKAYENCEFGEKQIEERQKNYREIKTKISKKINELESLSDDKINKIKNKKEETIQKVKIIETENEEIRRKKEAILKQKEELKEKIEKTIESFENKIEIKF